MTSMIMASYQIFFLLFILCNFPFYQSEAARVPPTDATASQGKGGMSSGTIVAIVIPISVVVLISTVGMLCLSKRKRKKHHSNSESAIDIGYLHSLQYDISTIQTATKEFSKDNKIGQGGFGVVYKGMLPNGQEIAVKRLSRVSKQSVEEFKNEVQVLANVQHTNLVRLLGFCVQGKENILVYEYMPNKSLDHILFDPEKQRHLDWTKRCKIIKGVSRGIQYLHEDSRLRIIHRDLKASNVLLDNDMNPKITDFGLSIIFSIDQTQGSTHCICGTWSYMSPEYMMYGKFSVKSDVYSFGVLIIEIMSGMRNDTSFHEMEGSDDDLLSHAWSLWKYGQPFELLHPTVRECCDPSEVMRCIHIALLCVQKNPEDRPSMSSILVMLENYHMTLPTPSRPPTFHSPAESTPISENEMSDDEVMPR